jgi:hypothetical protein
MALNSVFSFIKMTDSGSTFCRCSFLLKGCLHLRIGVSITNMNVSVWQNKYTNFKSLSDILIKLKTEFNAIGSGNWEWINFNRQLDDHKVIFSWRTLGQTLINRTDRYSAGPTIFANSWLRVLTVTVLCQTDTFIFVIETPIRKCKHPFSRNEHLQNVEH